MATRMQQRRGTASQWSGANPILNAGEIGWESDTNKFKIGDGTNHWADLAYFSDAASITAAINNLVDGAPQALDTLNEIAAALGDNANFLADLATEQFVTDTVTENAPNYSTLVGSGLQYADGQIKLDNSYAGEVAMDAIAGALNSGTGLQHSYDDTANTLTIDIDSTVATKTYADDAVGTHNSDTSSVHGIADTAQLVTLSGTETLVNKTLNNFTLNLELSEPVTLSSGGSSSTYAATQGPATRHVTNFDLLRSTNFFSNSVVEETETGIRWQNPPNQTWYTATWASMVSWDGYNSWSAETPGEYTCNIGDTLNGQTCTTVTGASTITREGSTNVYRITNPTTAGYNGADNDGYAGMTFASTPYTGVLVGSSQDNGDILIEFAEFPDTTFPSGTVATVTLLKEIDSNEFGYLDGVTSNIQTQLDAKAASSDLSTHASDTTNIHGIADTAELATKTYADDALTSHSSATTSVHGIADTSLLATLGGTQTLTNKRLASPKINEDVALTSTATELNLLDGVTGTLATTAGTQTLSNKTLNNPLINLSLSDAVTLTAAGSSSTYAATEVTTNPGWVVTDLQALGAAYDSYRSGTIDTFSIVGQELRYRVASGAGTGNYYTEPISNIVNNTGTTAAYYDNGGTSYTCNLGDTLDGQTCTHVDVAGSTIVREGSTNVYRITNPTTAGFNGADNDGYAGMTFTSDPYTGLVIASSQDGSDVLITFAEYPDTTFPSGTVSTVQLLKSLSLNEIGYLDGVTSAVQDQIDAKSPLASPTFTGTVSLDDLEIAGDLTFSGTATQINQTDLTLEDPIIYLAEGNTANINDLGFVAAFDNGTYQHTGLVRDSSEGAWKLFKGVTDEPTNTVNFAQGSLDDLKVAGLTVSSISIGEVSNTEVGHLSGVTSAIQTQLDDKAPTDAPTFTGTVTVAADGVAFTDGTQTKEGVPSRTPIIQKTDNYTLTSLTERDSLIEVSSSQAKTITIPTNSSVAYPVGTSIDILQTSTGQVTIAGDAGVTVNATPGLKLRTQWSSATLFKRAEDTWVVYGDLTA